MLTIYKLAIIVPLKKVTNSVTFLFCLSPDKPKTNFKT